MSETLVGCIVAGSAVLIAFLRYSNITFVGANVIAGPERTNGQLKRYEVTLGWLSNQYERQCTQKKRAFSHRDGSDDFRDVAKGVFSQLFAQSTHLLGVPGAWRLQRKCRGRYSRTGEENPRPPGGDFSTVGARWPITQMLQAVASDRLDWLLIGRQLADDLFGEASRTRAARAKSASNIEGGASFCFSYNLTAAGEVVLSRLERATAENDVLGDARVCSRCCSHGLRVKNFARSCQRAFICA